MPDDLETLAQSALVALEIAERATDCHAALTEMEEATIKRRCAV